MRLIRNAGFGLMHKSLSLGSGVTLALALVATVLVLGCSEQDSGAAASHNHAASTSTRRGRRSPPRSRMPTIVWTASRARPIRTPITGT